MTKQNLIPYSFLMTEKQNEELKNLYESLNCQNITEFFNKMIEFSKVISKMHQQNWDCILIDKKEMELIPNPKTQEVIMLFKNKASYDFITKDVNDIMELKRQIANTNNFGLPIDMDEYKA